MNVKVSISEWLTFLHYDYLYPFCRSKGLRLCWAGDLCSFYRSKMLRLRWAGDLCSFCRSKRRGSIETFISIHLTGSRGWGSVKTFIPIHPIHLTVLRGTGASKHLFLFISQFWGAQGASKHWSSQFWEAQGASKHLFLFSSLILGHVALLYEAWFHVYWKTITDYLIGQIGIDCQYLISNRSNHVYQSTLQWNYCV